MVARGGLALAGLAVALMGACGKGSSEGDKDDKGTAGETQAGTGGDEGGESRARVPLELAIRRCEVTPVGANFSGRVKRDPCDRPGRPPRVGVGEARVGRGLDRADVGRKVSRNLAKIRDCYATVLAGDSSLEGTVHVDLVINGDGRAGSVVVEGVSEEIEACVEGVMSGLLYPRPSDGDAVRVYLSFVLDSCKREPSTDRDDLEPHRVAEAEVTQSLAEQLHTMRRCLQSSLDLGVVPPESVRLDLAIQSDGTVADARSPDSAPDEATREMHRCIAEIAEGLTFPESEVGTRRARCTISTRPTGTP